MVPGTEMLLTGTWVMIMLAYAVRRLPYALRSCVAALQQVHVSLEEAAESLGATKMRTIRRVVVPLMAGGILAGFVTSFITAAVELSATILLTSAESQAPMSYGIYLYMQSIAGRGPGAALGVLAIVVVAHRHLPVAPGGRAHRQPPHGAAGRRDAAAAADRPRPPEPEDHDEKSQRAMPQRAAVLRHDRGAEGRQPRHRARRVLRAARALGFGQDRRCCG